MQVVNITTSLRQILNNFVENSDLPQPSFIMNTPTHVILSLALIGKKRSPEYHLPIFLGSILPDITMFLFYAWEKFQQVPDAIIWGEHYFLDHWQLTFDVFNSFPIIVLAFGIAYWLKRAWWQYCFAGMFLHCVFDFPLHSEDAHRHFWPLTDYRFESPISYWDPNKFGDIVATIEILGALGLSVYLFTMLQSRFAKSTLVAVNLFGIYVYLRFVLFGEWG